MGSRKGVALVGAIRLGEPAAVRGLLDAGVDPNARDNEGVPALVVAARLAHPEMVSLLLDKGAAVSATDPGMGATALHAAAACLWGGLADGDAQ